MLDHWELIDLVKAAAALIAGMLLGLERELKDKAAGLKTITIICLGATLFSILSFKVGDTRIAAYIVGGVGFLGAGVIFKEGINISGLTTAGIIWFSAAVGTAIGYGRFWLAAIFLLIALALIFFGSHINRLFRNKKQTRELVFEMTRADLPVKEEILADIRHKKILIKENIIQREKDHVRVIAEIVADDARISWLQGYLLQHAAVSNFSV